jgi:hypothetical protein
MTDVSHPDLRSLPEAKADISRHPGRCSDGEQVLFIDDLALILRTSRATIERRRKNRTFPIPEMPSLDSRPRWSRKAVDAYLASTAAGQRKSRRAA